MRTNARLLFLVPILMLKLSAQVVWTANGTTAVPNFQSTGVIKTMTVDATIHGRGVRPRMTAEGMGVSFLYVPVTAPQASTFACIGLRAADNSPTGSIRAEFIRQPRNGNPAPAATLGAVGTFDAAGDGFQFVTAPFAAQVINYNLFTYYVRLVMNYQGAATALIPSPIAFDVSLSSTCNF